jgi:hypothetical protein
MKSINHEAPTLPINTFIHITVIAADIDVHEQLQD